MNMKFGYARVSKNDQSLDVQLQKLREVGCTEIFQEKISGAKDERQELQRLMEKLRKGDTVYVVRLDRLGRRMTNLIELVNEFKEKGVEFVSLENNIDTATPMGMLLFNMCAAFAEMERELIRERVKAGLEIAHKRGRMGGRPRVVTPEKIDTLKGLRRSREFSVRQMCAMAKVSRSGYYRAVGEGGP
ncbi:MAG: recombinase family protein [Alphaproteobacteria bacterium]